MHVLVDTRRHVLLSIEHRSEGKVTSAERYGDFVEAAGCWWAGRVENVNAEGKVTSRTIQKFADLKAAELDARIKRELAVKDAVQLLREPGVKLSDAKRAAAAGKATFDDQMTLLMHFAAQPAVDPRDGTPRRGRASRGRKARHALGPQCAAERQPPPRRAEETPLRGSGADGRG